MYVLKFRGAGQGPRVLIAELIAGELARRAGLSVPEIVLMDLDPVLARSEPDSEIRELIKASAGLNVAMDYLPGSLTFDPVINMPDADLASAIVWFDALVANVDRTARNPNMLMWHRKLWLIDHGAALYVHHGDDNFSGRARESFGMIGAHVLLSRAASLRERDEQLAELMRQSLREVVAAVPDELIVAASQGAQPDRLREEYVSYLDARLESPRIFLQDALNAR